MKRKSHVLVFMLSTVLTITALLFTVGKPPYLKHKQACHKHMEQFHSQTDNK